MTQDTTKNSKKDIRDRNFAFIDLEMTGLSFEEHEIVEIGLVLARHEEKENGTIAMKVVGEYEWKVLPNHIETADPVALRINGYTPEKWKEAVSLEKALSELSEITEEAVMVGHNVAFDFSFLEKAFSITGIENKMHYHKLDTISIAFAKLHNEPELCRFSLHELSEYFAIKNENAHTALSDTKATFALYEKLMEQ